MRAVKTTRAVTCIALGLTAAVTSGCGFFASAGEIPLGLEQGIPEIKQEIAFPSVDELTGGDLNAKLGATDPETGKPLISGVPTSLKKTTLAHVQGLLALAGVCRKTISVDEIAEGAEDPKDPKTDAAAASPVSNITVTVTNCTGDPRCSHVCGEWQGIELEAGATIQILTADQAAELAEQLAQAGGTKTAADALVALRLYMYQLDLFQGVDDANKDPKSLCNKATTTGKVEAYRECTTNLLADFELVLQHADLPEGESSREATETPVITYANLKGLTPDQPRRFVVDANATVTGRIKALVVAQKATKVRVVQRLRVKRPDLFEMNFDGAGLIIHFQPEVVVSVTELIKSVGGVK